jgi:hypothetical protein
MYWVPEKTTGGIGTHARGRGACAVGICFVGLGDNPRHDFLDLSGQ